MQNLESASIEGIIAKMNTLISTKPSTVNGARGASILYQKLHEELDRRAYDGERPSRQFSHPSMTRGNPVSNRKTTK